ncbi:MAG: penicillin-binding protein 2 [Chromatiales bacterium]|nr:penicillin-binding protein 2 [Gammaproteobacteria bacterium]MBW6476346.1 penicillin-binding protein 2 [Chromatiales bacterium]
MSKHNEQPGHPKRLAFVKGLMLLAVAALLWRMGDLNLNQRDFLQGQGDARTLRVVAIAADRGMITDRNGEPLAISAPVESVWAQPQDLAHHPERWSELAQLLGIPPMQLATQIAQRQNREFLYLRRHITPEHAEQVMALGIPGVSLQREYRRYYPMGEVTGHLLGFTNIDDVGQEGIELMMEATLRGTPGSKRVLRDRLGRVVQNVESIAEPRPGQDVQLSLDRRVQYLAYRELKAAVQRHRASAGSLVILDVTTGEVLAMVNQPAFNPNNRADLDSRRFRNRAVTDVMEPGSTMKPFTVAAALETGRFDASTLVNTSPGMLRVGGFTIRDIRDYGRLSLSEVLEKSSNVGASRVAMSIEPKRLWDTYVRFGFGYDTASRYPGEAQGRLRSHRDWREADRASISYGYGLSVTPLQLAQAYAALADDGRQRPVSFFKLDREQLPRHQQVIDARIAREVLGMLEASVQDSGTGSRARVAGYRIAGKTGTVRKAVAGGYDQDLYLSVFAGMAPASKPRLAMVVVIDGADDGNYYGGVVAAPVFARVMEGALRLLDVPPDDLDTLKGMRVAVLGAE